MLVTLVIWGINSEVSLLVAARGGMDLMPEQQTKPVNQYLPPRARPQPEDTASLVAMAEAAEPKGFWKWVDSTLDKISGGA